GASFANAKLATGFTSTTYVGAFAQNDNWHQGWTEFDPINAEYDVLQTSVSKIEPVLNMNVYPNPANGVVSINFDLLASEEITVEVIDLTGKVVATPSKGMMEAGSQSLNADLGGLNNGVYFVVVKTENGVQTTKV